ncbi:hypothetical protein NBRC10513v2_005317 [Rhodotorula toruloides]
MAAAVAHELTQTFVDKPWANAYPLSFLPSAGNAVRPISSVRGGDEPVELDIELPVDEWGDVGSVQDSEVRATQEPAHTKRQREDEPTSDFGMVAQSETGGWRRRRLSPLPTFASPTSFQLKNRRQGMPYLNRSYPLPMPRARSTRLRPASPPRQEPSSAPAGLYDNPHGFIFDFATSAAPSEQAEKRRSSTTSTSTDRKAPPKSPTLTHDMLFPSLRGLTFQDYEQFLLDTPITPVWSAPLYEAMLSFFRFCAPCAVWAKDPDRVSAAGKLAPIARQLLACQPNRQAIQAVYKPQSAPGYETLDARLKSKFRAMRDAMRWLFDDSTLQVDSVAHLVRKAPLPLYILVRELASVIHLCELTQHAERELTQHLASLRRVSPHEAAAIVLLRWLQQIRTPNRHYVFFAHSNGSLRFDDQREPPWAWWFKRVEVGDPCTTEVLDEWEKGVLAEEDWSNF